MQVYGAGLYCPDEGWRVSRPRVNLQVSVGRRRMKLVFIRYTKSYYKYYIIRSLKVMDRTAAPFHVWHHTRISSRYLFVFLYLLVLEAQRLLIVHLSMHVLMPAISLYDEWHSILTITDLFFHLLSRPITCTLAPCVNKRVLFQSYVQHMRTEHNIPGRLMSTTTWDVMINQNIGSIIHQQDEVRGTPGEGNCWLISVVKIQVLIIICLFCFSYYNYYYYLLLLLLVYLES
jgi:hypothetical protein